MLDATEVAQLLAAGGVGGLLTTLVTNTSDRRRVRLELLKAIREFDNASPAERSRLRLDQSYANAALVAGMPRRIVLAYLRSADIVKVRESHALGVIEDHRKNPTSENEVRVAEYKRRWEASLRGRDQIRRMQLQMIWHPWITSVTWQTRLAVIPRDAKRSPGPWSSTPPP